MQKTSKEKEISQEVNINHLLSISTQNPGLSKTAL